VPIYVELNENRQALILGYLMCPEFDEPKKVRFLVDTGASTTTILPVDVFKLGIECNALVRSSRPCTTANGAAAYPFQLPSAVVYLPRNDESGDFDEIPLPFVLCMPFPPLPNKHTMNQPPYPTFSVLGMDVLKRYKYWVFTDKYLMLKENMTSNSL
jgi:hypothetical protein